MTQEQELERLQLENVVEAARELVTTYDEFGADPSCIGEPLAALIDALDKIGD